LGILIVLVEGGTVMKKILGSDSLRTAQTSRRGLMFGAASLAAAAGALAVPGLAQQISVPPHKRPVPKRPAAKAAEPATANPALVSAAARCDSVGTICLNHCIRLTRAGDKSIADCMRAVQAMLPVCRAIRQLAGQDARRLKDMARVCMAVCSDCEDECRKHEFHHVECRNCAEACAAMVRECKVVIGA
jgi:Cys-rich four helix bundle protein (predicted Tat secretion target)